MAADERKERATADTVAADTADPSRATGSAAATSSAGTEKLGGRYRIDALVGSGGMGSVYRAFDLELDEVVALKMLRPELLGSADALESLKREVKLARKVTHKNVARTYDIGDNGRDKFMTMELVDGQSLAHEMERTGTMSARRVLDVLVDVCAGLAAAHEAGVVHRDLKPENVLLARDGRVVVTDFGIACAAAESRGERVGVLVGTPAYMAPEQVEGADVGARADLYALGVMAFEMLTGRLPWTGDTPAGVATARLYGRAPDVLGLRPNVRPGLAAAVARCLERDPRVRFESADAAREAFEASRRELDASKSTMPSTTPPPERSWVSMLGKGEGAKTVAVLPIQNLGATPDDDLVAGLTDDLVDTLSMTKGLRVLPRATVAQHAPRDRDPREVGREMGVQVVVHGSVRRVGDRVRVNARLVTIEDGFQIWAKRFDASPADLLVVSDQLAHAIAAALTSDLAAPERAPVAGAAVELYLRGRMHLRGFWREDMERSAAVLEEALALAPDDPTVLATYARACARVLFYGGAEGREYGRRAQEAAERAMKLADHLGEPWYALASVRLNQGDHAGAAKALRAALVRAPRLVDAHEMLGRVLLEVGEPRQAIARLETAWSIEPGNLMTRMEISRAHALMGDWDAVDSWLWHAPESEAAKTWFIITAARLSMWRADGRATLDRIPAFDAGLALPLFYAQSVIGAMRSGSASAEQQEQIVMTVRMAEAGTKLRPLIAQFAAEMLGWAHNDQGALEMVRAAVDAGLVDRTWMERCPLLAGIRERPEFADLAKTVEERATCVVRALEMV